MTHAWLITGPPGSGRSTAARAFAQALQCVHPTVVGCGECEGCLAVARGTHADVTWIQPEGLQIGIDTARAVVRESAALPTVGRWRIVVIEDADRLTEPAANAVLKSVEEPPAHTVIVFCAPSTDPEDFSVTLRSRCRHVYIPTPSVGAVADLLVAEGSVSREHAQLAAAATGAHIGRARILATQPAVQSRRAKVLGLAELVYQQSLAFQEVSGILQAITAEVEEFYKDAEEKELERLLRSLGQGVKGKGAAKLTRGIKGQSTDLEKAHKRRRTRAERDHLDVALVDLSGIYRDALTRAVGAEEIALIHPDFERISAELAQRNSPAALIACLDAIMQCRDLLSKNVRPQVALDGLIGALRSAQGVT